MDRRARLEAATKGIQQKCLALPKTAVILGSGLSEVASQWEGLEIPYDQIPHMPRPTVAGHRGILKITPQALFFLGRFHWYEGWSPEEVVFPVDLVKSLGLKNLIVTNASGGIREDLNPGDLVLISDHLNLMGMNPLIGPNDPSWGPRFPDMTQAYSSDLRKIAQEVVKNSGGAPLPEGVYAALSGPNYETPAEIRMLARLGADLVGMSTIPEVLRARYHGLEVLGVSCVTNKAAGLGQGVLDHKEVVETGKRVQSRVAQLILDVTQRLENLP